MSNSATPLDYAIATWVFLLDVDGVTPGDEAIASRCKAIAAASGADEGNAAGESLVQRVHEMLSGDSPSDVTALARSLYGDRVDDALGSGDRAERVHRIRRYQFARNLPWLARIWERDEHGQVNPSWLVVERVTDEVAAMDPNPWNDIDENRRLALTDFQVLWELDGCTAVAVA